MADRKFLFVRIAALSFMTVTASALLFAAEGDYQLPVTVNEKQQTDSSVEVFAFNATSVAGSPAVEVVRQSAAETLPEVSPSVVSAEASEVDTVMAQEPAVITVALLQEPESPSGKTADLPASTGAKAKLIAKTTTIRSGPGSLYDVLGWAGTGAGIETLEQQGQWLKVRMTDSGRVGWIEADALNGSAVPQPVEAFVSAEPVVVETSPVDSQAAAKQVTVTSAAEVEPAPAVVVSEVEEAAPILPEQESAVVPQVDEAVTRPEPVEPVAAEAKPMESPVAETAIAESSQEGVVTLPAVAKQSKDGVVTVFNTGGAAALETSQVESSPLTEVQLAEPVAQTYEAAPQVAQAEVSLPEVEAQMTEPAAQVVEAAAQTEVPVVEEKTTVAESRLNKLEPEASAAAAPVVATPSEDGAVTVFNADEAVPAVTAPIDNNASEPLQAVTPANEQAPAVLVQQAEVPASESAAVNKLLFSSTANLRAGPDVKYDVVAWAAAGAYANEMKSSGDWIQVQLQESKRMGWVHQSSVKPAHAVASDATATVAAQAAETAAPVAAEQEVIAAPQQAAAGGDEKQLTQTTTMRSAPGALSEMLGWAGSGAMVAVLAQQDGWLKVRMKDSGRVGWIESTAVDSRQQL
ncbi:MAG: hypothetical protein CO187_02185, partial [Zetaproteobacteria bacterium CG_4_9_14_3_um_filter_53_7]